VVLDENFPALQAAHAVAPAEGVIKPETQLTHSPCPENPCALPARQSSQFVVFVENLPDPHVVQLVAPVLGAIEPGKQLEHTEEPAVEKFPGLQRIQLEAPTPLAFPASHAWHTSEAVEAAKKPAGHGLQEDALSGVCFTSPPPVSFFALAAYLPTSQLSQPALPRTSAAWPAPQEMHALGSVDPMLEDASPFSHMVHSSERGSAEKDPAPQKVHSVDPAAANFPGGQSFGHKVNVLNVVVMRPGSQLLHHFCPALVL